MTDYITALASPGAIYHREAARLADDLTNRVSCRTINEAGVMRWTSNGSVPPADIIALAAHLCLPVDEAACTACREADTTAFLAAYRANPPKLTNADLAEARNAFGVGATVIDVITGQRIKL